MSVTTSHQIQGLKLLEGKVAVIYGASGGVGTSVAKAFAREGASVFLTGRTENSLDPIAQEISHAGGVASVSKVDALSPESVEAHLQSVVSKAGKLDISFNLIGTSVAIGTKLTELSDERFADAAFKKVRSYFITMTAAARLMEKQGNGVILGLTAPNARLPRPNMGGFAIGGAAIEALCRQLAFEVGPRGVRVVCLRTGGTPDNPVLHEVFTRIAKLRGTSFQAVADSEAQVTALKRAPLLPDVANAAVLIASDYASGITATAINASCGELVD
jgi:3-oxoacyl-[acyl-carrier protein] reductase